MDTTSMNSDNTKTSDPRRLLFNLFYKPDLKKSEKYVGLSYLSVSNTRKNIKNSQEKNKFKTSAPTQNLYVRYSKLFGVYHLKHDVMTKDSPIRINVNKVRNL